MLIAYERQANQSLKGLLTLKLNYPHRVFELFVNKTCVLLVLFNLLFFN
jgi:hypothetical protein